MSLPAGTRLGPYEILAPLGAGGMGEVYRGRDSRLDRTIAVKVLPRQFSADPDRRARFEREAKAISSLSHPHICALYDVGFHEEMPFLVMEYLEGDTLAERLRKGPLPMEQVLRYGTEIAEALDCAHRQGTVHRDLKPGNIMLTRTGAKLLDFGLAKFGKVSAAGEGTSALSTRARLVTQEGTILGTLPYMAPEQLEGKESDPRADVWALGLVLYEMASGRQAFGGTTQASLIAAILKDDPPTLATLVPMTPPGLDQLVRTCLAKEPDRRWQSAHDVAVAISWNTEAGTTGSAAPAAGPLWPREPSSSERPRHRPRRDGSSSAMGRPDAPMRIVSAIIAPENASFSVAGGPMALSPDGRTLAFVARTNEGKTFVWLRPLDALAARALPGTENAACPFWSPDSKWIGFFANGKLKKVEGRGGEAESLADAAVAWGASWGADGTILFAPGRTGPIMKLAPDGGMPSPATDIPEASRAAVSHRWPVLLPDGRHFLYVSLSRMGEADGLCVGSLETSETRRLAPILSSFAFAPPGLLVYWHQGELRAQKLDLRTLKLGAEVFRVAEQVRFDPDQGAALFSVSSGGLLAYLGGGPARLSRLSWFDRTGRETSELAPPALYYTPTLSHDGRRVAVDLSEPLRANGDIWIHDVARKVSTRLTFDRGDESVPEWSPDDAHIVFRRVSDLYRIPTSGVGTAECVLAGPDWKRPLDWSPDGRFVLFEVRGASGKTDVWALSLADGQATPWLATPFSETGARFSPDGRWVAYASDESGRMEVYVRGFLEPGQKTLISTAGGATPLWRRDGGELFYVSADKKLMAVPVMLGTEVEAGTPEVLFEAPVREVSGIRQYDVSPDGQRFLLNRMMDEETSVAITLVQAWSAGLRE